MLYLPGEWHRIKRAYKKLYEEDEWLLITGREKKGKDTIVSVKNEDGIEVSNLSTKKLHKKARH